MTVGGELKLRHYFLKELVGGLVAVSSKVGGFEKVSSFMSIPPEIPTKWQTGKQLQNT